MTESLLVCKGFNHYVHISFTLDSSFGSTSEIASCSYEARSLGVKNGMWLGRARQLCPNIVCVPYQFNEYRKVSQQLYEILASHTHEIQAVSCDEAFVDLTNYTEAGQSGFNCCKLPAVLVS